MRPLLPFVLAASVAAVAPEPPDPETVRQGLLASGRAERERAAASVRAWSRLDPLGAAALWEDLDLRGKTELVRAIAGAGTTHAAQVALRFAKAPEPEVFQALLHGLADGGEKALAAEIPEDVPLLRRDALSQLRYRWKVEAELVRLKSPSGPTGHFAGQYKRLQELGRGVVPILLDIVRDRAHPFPNEGAEGPYRAIHPEIARYDPYELRDMAAHSFGEVVQRDDVASVTRIYELWSTYWKSDQRVEQEDLAPALAFSLWDLGVRGPAETYIAWLRSETDNVSLTGLQRLCELGYANIRIGRYDEGEEAYKLVLDWSPSKALAAYNLACNFAIRSREDPGSNEERFKATALDYLERSIHEYNYGDWGWMEEDGDLDAIRDEPRYKALLSHLMRKYPARKKGDVSKKPEDFLVPGRPEKPR